MKRGLILSIIILAIIININIISAEIMFDSQPALVYSINDMIDSSLTVKTTQASEGFLKIILVCGDKQNDFYLSPLSLQPGIEEKISKKLTLSKSFLGEMKGDCKILAKYDGEEESTSNFKISEVVSIKIDPLVISTKPGEKISIKGTATKSNSQPLDGFLELKVEGTDIRLTKGITAGNIEADLNIPETMKSGGYSLILIAYDKLNNEVSNYGDTTLSLNFKQEPSNIELELDKQSIIPGTSLNIIPRIYDKASQEIQEDVKIDVTDAYDDFYVSKLIRTGEAVEIKIEMNATPGYWTIEASALGLNIKRLFYVEELQKARFEVFQDSLTITNIGNVVYTKVIQVAIGNEVDIKEMNLDIGESKTFKLSGDGNYPVSVSDGVDSVDFGDMSLTGNVLGVMELRKTGFLNQYPIVWLFLIIIFGLFILMMVQRVSKRKVNGYVSKPFVKQETKQVKQDIEVKNIKNAEHSLVLHGNKEQAALMNLKIKNLDKISQKEVKEAIERSLEDIGRSKGTIYRSGQNFTGIFTPSVTKTFRNDLIAVKVASEIARYLNEHNSKSTQKIDFGIGINSGNIAAKVDKDVLKFTSLGNEMNLARRISDAAENSVLLSPETSKKVMNDVKTEKAGEYYSIKKLVEREQHKKFINGFLDRQRAE